MAHQHGQPASGTAGDIRKRKVSDDIDPAVAGSMATSSSTAAKRKGEPLLPDHMANVSIFAERRKRSSRLKGSMATSPSTTERKKGESLLTDYLASLSFITGRLTRSSSFRGFKATPPFTTERKKGESLLTGLSPANKSQKQSYNISRIINSEGGEVAGEGVKLVIPPGAVEEPVTISAAFEDPFRYYRLIVQKDLENDVAFAAPIIKLRPNGQVFKIPVQLTTKFTISDFKKTDVIVLHGTEDGDRITWEDVTHYSNIDEASEEVTTEMEHFTIRLVLVRRTWIRLKSIGYWLTSCSFHYTLSVLMKKSDQGSILNLVFMSQDVYNEEFYREHSDTSALVQLKRNGFKELHLTSIDSQHDKCVYNNEKLQISIRLEENYRLVDTEERRITVQSTVWWARGHVEEMNLGRISDISVVGVKIKIHRESGHDCLMHFGESELHRVRILLGVQRVPFNVKPVARRLLVSEQTLTEIEKFWKDEDKQLEIVLGEWKKKTDDHDLSEIPESLKHEGQMMNCYWLYRSSSLKRP